MQSNQTGWKKTLTHTKNSLRHLVFLYCREAIFFPLWSNRLRNPSRIRTPRVLFAPADYPFLLDAILYAIGLLVDLDFTFWSATEFKFGHQFLLGSKTRLPSLSAYLFLFPSFLITLHRPCGCIIFSYHGYLKCSSCPQKAPLKQCGWTESWISYHHGPNLVWSCIITILL